MKFYASVRIDLRRIESIKSGEDIIGNRVKAKVVKNKVASPFKEAEFEIYFQEGISEAADILDLAVTHEIIQKSGAWFSFENEKIGQGRESTRKYLKDNPKVAAKIKKQVIEKIKTKPKV